MNERIYQAEVNINFVVDSGKSVKYMMNQKGSKKWNIRSLEISI